MIGVIENNTNSFSRSSWRPEIQNQFQWVRVKLSAGLVPSGVSRVDLFFLLFTFYDNDFINKISTCRLKGGAEETGLLKTNQSNHRMPF